MQKSSRTTFRTVLSVTLTLSVGALLAGCGVQPEQGTSSCDQHASCSGHHDDHGHQHAAEGPHGGQLIELGDGQYHAELVHDKAAHTVTVYLLDAEAKKPTASDQTEITLQLFEDGQFDDYTLAAVAGNAPGADASQFAIVNEKLSDTLLSSSEVSGRLKVSMQGKPLTGIVEKCDHHDHDDHDHDKG